jgi:hypothetical protein
VRGEHVRHAKATPRPACIDGAPRRAWLRADAGSFRLLVAALRWAWLRMAALCAGASDSGHAAVQVGAGTRPVASWSID